MAVSEEAKAAAAKKAAEAKKAAGAAKPAAKSAPAKKEAAPEKKAPAKKAAPKKEAPVKEAEEVKEEVAEEVAKPEPAPVEAKKAANESKPSGNTKPLRIASIILWAFAILFEVGAFFHLGFVIKNNAVFGSTEVWVFIANLVLDAVCCIVAAQLWKKANRIKPCLANSAFVRTIWHQLGVIMVLICFLPIGIFLLVKSDKIDGKLKTILLVLTAALFVGATASSVDFRQPNSDQVKQLQEEAKIEAATQGVDEVYWTQFGKCYHFDKNCSHIRGKDLAITDENGKKIGGGTLFGGTLDQAFESNRWDPCDECAGGKEAKVAETSDAAVADAA